MTEARELTLSAAAARLRSGELDAQTLLQSYLERIAQREADVKAWVRIDADEALRVARRCDREAAQGHWRGPLHGLVLGIKDIFDVQGMETRAGSDAYTPRIAASDAECVARLRAAGAIFLGKTVTTAFAMGDPGATCNPWRRQHTPGGSSSGSAAAVADRMCGAALGSQTAGSVIRPASFNGVVGFKPGYAAISVEGVIPLSWQLDHVGSLTRSVTDAWMLWQVMRSRTVRSHVDAALQVRKPEKLWRVRDFFETQADAEILTALDDCCQRLAAQGIEIVEKPLPVFARDGMLDAHRMIMASDAAAFHRPGFITAGSDRYPPRIRELIEEGLQNQAIDYSAARQQRTQLIAAMNAGLNEVDAAIMPAATGPAPAGLDYTGDRLFNILSSFCGLPVVSLPVALSRLGLPLGIQLLGAEQSEDRLLEFAACCETILPFPHRP
jgi:aspartyl-tRNA(Asn)/glutamyl-tRNA(Gln) amidotransferase subunit A